MLVFVDESGDTGIKAGASRLFTLTFVVFDENREAEAASLAIDKLRGALNLTQDTEFHFNGDSNRQRAAFLNAVSSFQYSVFSAVVDKSGIAAEGISNKESFYKFVCGLVLEEAKKHLVEANVTIDSSGDLNFKRSIAKHLKQQVNAEGGGGRRIKNVTMKPSHSDNLLQLADMVCGAVARSECLDSRRTDRFRQIIKHREVSVLVWSK